MPTRVTDPSILAQLNKPDTVAPNPMFPGQLQGQALGNQKTALDIQKTAGTLAADEAKAKADAQKARIDAQTAQEQWNISHPNPNAPGGTLTGPAYLHWLQQSDPGRAAYIQGLSEGRVAFPGPQMMRSPAGMALLNQVMRADPTIDATNYTTRAAARKNAATGHLGDSDNALITAIGHISRLNGLVPDVWGTPVKPFNAVANSIDSNFFQGKQPTYEQNQQLAGNELAAAYGAKTEGKQDQSGAQFDENLSTDRKRDNIQGAVDLLMSKLAANRAQFAYGNGQLSKPDFMLLPPQVREEVMSLPGGKDLAAKYFAGIPVMGQNGGTGAPPPSNGGNPPTPPDYSTMVPNGGGLGGGSAPSGSQTTNVYDPQTSALVNGYLKKGLSYHDAVAQLAKDAPGANLAGLTSPSQWNAALAWRQVHPNANTNQVPATKSVPLSMGDQILNNVAQNPAGAFAGHYYNALSADLPELAAGQDRSAFFNGVSGAQNPWSSRIGDIAGTIGGMSLTGKGVGAAAQTIESRFPNYAALLAGSAPRQALTGDTIYSGISGAAQNPDHPVLGASLGMLAAAGGNAAGRYIGGPIVSAIADTRPGQAVVNGVRSLGQLAGKTPAPFAPPPAPAISLTGATQNALPDITSKLTQAQNAGLPYMLADADPRLAKLLGSATRFSPDVYDQASGILGPRQLGQGERAISQINTNLAPVGDIDAIKSAQIQAAQAAAKPLYDQTYSLPGRTNGQLDALLNTPAGKQALLRARTIAANEQRDPNAIGIDLNAQGEPTLTSLPSPQTIDYVKRGLDDILEQYRNPVTGQMNLDEAGRATLGVKNGILQQADLLWPDYGQARAAYAADASKATDAQRGFDSASKGVTPDTVSSVVSGLPESNLPFFQQGYASNMGNAINNQRFSGNPYDLVNGSLGQKAKLATIFPQGADAFNTAQGLEGDMSRTNQIVLGNSTTQNKAMDDKLFTLGDGVDAGLDMGNVALSGGNPLLALGGLALRKGIDSARYGMSRAKADAISPFLMNPDPSLNLANLNLWAQQNAARRAYLDTIGAGAGQIGAGLAGAPAIYGFSQN